MSENVNLSQIEPKVDSIIAGGGGGSSPRAIGVQQEFDYPLVVPTNAGDVEAFVAIGRFKLTSFTIEVITESPADLIYITAEIRRPVHGTTREIIDATAGAVLSGHASSGTEVSWDGGAARVVMSSSDTVYVYVNGGGAGTTNFIMNAGGHAIATGAYLDHSA